MDARVSSLSKDIVAALVVVLLCTTLSWPVFQFSLAGGGDVLNQVTGGGDGLLYYYFFKVGAEKLTGLELRTMFDGGFFYPKSDSSLFFTEHTLGVTAALLPILACVHDARATMALGGIAAFIAGWVASFALARTFGVDRLLSIGVALLFGTSGAYLTLMARPFFWPLALALWIVILIKRTAEGHARHILAGVLLGFLGWSSSHLSVMTVALSLLVVGGAAVQGRLQRRSVKRLLTTGAIACALVAPVAILQAVTLYQNGFNRTLEVQTHDPPNIVALIGSPWLHSGRMLVEQLHLGQRAGETPIAPSAIVFLSLILGCVGTWIAHRAERAQLGVRAIVIGAVAGGLVACVVLAIVRTEMARLGIDVGVTIFTYCLAGALITTYRKRLLAILRTPFGWCALMALAFLVLAFGPALSITSACAIPSPALLVLRLPGFSAIRVPVRWGILFTLCGAVLTGMLVQAIRRSLVRGVIGALIVVLATLDCIWPGHWRPFGPFPITPEWVRAEDEVLRRLPLPGAVLELPFIEGHKETLRMFARLNHRRPLVNGYAGFTPAFFLEHGGAAQGIHRNSGLDPAEISHLRSFGARYWVVHRDLLDEKARAAIGERIGPLARVAVVDEGRVMIYEDPEAK